MEMLSMTGFGVGEVSVAGMNITVELRAVNHRFLDIAMKLPPAFISWEMDIRNLLKSRLARGRVSCFVQVRRDAGDVSVANNAPCCFRGESIRDQGHQLIESADAGIVEASDQRPSDATGNLCECVLECGDGAVVIEMVRLDVRDEYAFEMQVSERAKCLICLEDEQIVRSEMCPGVETDHLSPDEEARVKAKTSEG